MFDQTTPDTQVQGVGQGQQDQQLDGQQNQQKPVEITDEDRVFGVEKDPSFYGVSRATEEQFADEEEVDESGRPISDNAADPLAGGENAQAQGQNAQQNQQGQPNGQQDQQRPLMVLNRNGQAYPIHDFATVHELASKGLDYTQKTQELASFRRELAALVQNPDIREMLHDRMSGRNTATAPKRDDARGNGQAVQSGQNAPKGLTPEELRQGDNEDFEQYQQRVAKLVYERTTGEAREAAIEAARAEAGAVRADVERVNSNRELLNGYARDPLFQHVVPVIAQMVESGNVSPEFVRRANENPDDFNMLYNMARQSVMTRVQQYQLAQLSAGGNGGSQPPNQQPAPQGQQGQHVSYNRQAPMVESGGGARRSVPSGKPDMTAKVLADMSDDQFDALQSKVKAGEGAQVWKQIVSR